MKRIKKMSESKVQDIYQKIKNDMSEEVKKSDAIDYYDVVKTEQNFLINEIAKLRLEIEELQKLMIDHK